MRVAVIGAGWAGCAAAVEATRLGHQVTLFEAARIPGGRARRVDSSLPGDTGTPLSLDNGQHILIGAYSETLQLMAELGVSEKDSLLRMPLTLQFPDGNGIRLPRLPAPLDALAGILSARGWAWGDRLSLLKVATRWQLGGFRCGPQTSVAELCRELSPGAMAQLIEPLCVSALNTPPARASGEVFLRVMHDSLFAASGGSNLLLPLQDLSALLPGPALAWLQHNGGNVRLGARVQGLAPVGGGWALQGDALDQPHQAPAFDGVLLACPPGEAARLAATCGQPCDDWLAQARGLQHEAITTVYAMSPGTRLAQPMLALPSGAGHPAQFVFDRGQLGGPAGLLAFVVSASEGDNDTLTRQVLAQGQAQLGLPPSRPLQPLQTIVEKRATFACTPGLVRPGMQLVPGIAACGDYVDGPYPATLEGAVRSGLAAARQLH